MWDYFWICSLSFCYLHFNFWNRIIGIIFNNRNNLGRLLPCFLVWFQLQLNKWSWIFYFFNLFQVLADRINLPCKLVKGSYYTGTDEGAVNFIKVDYDRWISLSCFSSFCIYACYLSPLNAFNESYLMLVFSLAHQLIF